jgi:hypothetical protein
MVELSLQSPLPWKSLAGTASRTMNITKNGDSRLISLRSKGVSLLIGVCLCVAGCGKNTPPTSATQTSTKNGDKEATDSKPPETNTAHAGAKIELHSEFEKYIELAKTDLDEALRLISTELPLSQQDKARVALLQTCPFGEWEKLQRLANAVQDLRARGGALSSIGFAWADRDPRQLFESAAKNMAANDTRNIIMYEAVRGTLRRGEYDEAKAMIDAMPFSRARLDAIGDFSTAFGKKDSAGALTWAQSLSSVEDRDRAFLLMSSVIADTQGLNGLTAILNSTNNENVQAGCINEAVKIVTHDDNAAAAQHWLDSLPPQFQGKALTTLIDATANTNFQEWTTAALALPEPRDEESALASIAYRWTASDPKQAAQWALTLPDDVRTSALSTLVSKWYDIDSEQLSSWVSALPQSGSRDTVLEYLAFKVKRTDKPTALNLANQIQDGGLKQQVLGSLNQ